MKMSPTIRGYCQIVLLLGWLGTLVATVMDADTESRVRAYVEKTMRCRKVPGLTMAVVKGNSTWMHGFGTADFDTGTSVDENSLFGIGSLTKAFTMTLLAGLLDEKGLSWTTKVREVLGHEFEFVDDLRTNETTLRDLLSHRTGLARLDLGWAAGYSRSSTTRAEVSRKLRYLPAQYEFRDKFLYNNYMFMLLGHICEKLGGDTWENLIKARLLAPLGMTSTTILTNPSDLKQAKVAKPYIYEDGDFKNGTEEIYSIFPVEPAGAIMTSAEDMTKWIKFNLNRGKTNNGTRLITEKMFDEALTATTTIVGGIIKKPVFPVESTVKGYAYGWNTGNYRGYELHQHGGGLFSYVTMLWIYPDLNLGLFTGVNGPAFDSNNALGSIMYYLSDTMLNETPWLNRTTSCTFPEPWVKIPPRHITPEETRSLVDGEEYAGVYRHNLLPEISVTFLNDSSNGSLRTDIGRLHGNLHPTRDQGRFLFEVTGPLEMADHDVVNMTALSINVTFKRDAGMMVNAVVFQLEVDVEFNKDGSSSVAISNSAELVSVITGWIVLLLSIACTQLGFN